MTLSRRMIYDDEEDEPPRRRPARRTLCVHGHRFDRVNARGDQVCLTCQRQRHARWQEKKRLLRSRKIDRAARWLERFLHSGPHPVNEICQAAKFSWDALQHAKTVLGVHSVRVTLWSLSKKEEPCS